MRYIETATELRTAWKAISAQLALDLGAMQRLAKDPLGTLREIGYEVGPEAATILANALP
tara:strand:- start:18 stop:197 length:180 start_codon:yes stop_codon:yes gene_type:complete